MMKKTISILVLLVLFLSVFSAAGLAVVNWHPEGPYWLDADGQPAGNTLTILEGQTAEAGSAAFVSTYRDHKVQYWIQLVAEEDLADPDAYYLLDSGTIDTTSMMGYLSVLVTEAAYQEDGKYYVWFILEDGDRREEPRSVILNVLPDADRDGVEDPDDACSDTPFGEAVDDNGCSCTDKADEIDDGNPCTNDACDPNTALITNTPWTGDLNVHACPADTCEGKNFVDYDDYYYDTCVAGTLVLGDAGTCELSRTYDAGCDTDDDNDGILDTEDNCPNIANPGQEDSDNDSIGDVCDSDDDNDGITDENDLCPATPVGEAVNTDGCSCSQLPGFPDFGSDQCNTNTCAAGVVTNNPLTMNLVSYACPADVCDGANLLDYVDGAVFNNRCEAGRFVAGSENECAFTLIPNAPECTSINDTDFTSVTLTATPSQGNEPLDVLFLCEAQGGDAPLTYHWNFGDGSAEEQTQVNNVVHTYDDEGNYVAVCTVYDADSDHMSDFAAVNVGSGQQQNNAPIADFVFLPVNPEVNEEVEFVSTSVDPDGDDLVMYLWEIDGQLVSVRDRFTYTFDAPRTYEVNLMVVDEYGLSDTVEKDVTVSGELTIGDVDCFSPIIVNNVQSCSVEVNANGGAVGNARVNLFYDDGQSLGTCMTDSLTGSCAVQWIETQLGWHNIYAEATKTGFDPDLTHPTARYEVIEEAYEIVDLGVYEDSGFSSASDSFYRGNPMYVKFRVTDGSGAYVSDMVSSVHLESSQTGGRGDFAVFQNDGSEWYYYFFDIPPTHEFKGDSQVFTFVFNFVDNTGAQKVVDVAILNNLPVIDDNVANEFNVVFDQTMAVDLSAYKSDVEDSGADLTWSVADVGTNMGLAIQAVDTLLVTPLSTGSGTFRLILTDLDGDFDEITLTVDTEAGQQLPECGNGLLEANEQCDDGNILSGDGCSAVCEIEQPIQDPECGNSVRETGEQCDDGNTADGDGCSAVCLFETGSPIAPRTDRQFSDSEVLFVNKIAMTSNGVAGEMFNAGDLLSVAVSVENNRDYDLDDVKITASIAELSIRDTDKFDLKSGDENTGKVFLDIPEWTVPGVYDLRIVVSNDDFHKIRHRDILLI